MPALARADLESLLRARKLDRTLAAIGPGAATTDEQIVAATGLAPLDAQLGGGFPRGQLSEIAGPPSAGRTALATAGLAAATRRGELVALVDALDRLDVGSAAAAGVDLDRLLWIRGFVTPNPGRCRDRHQHALEQAIRALTLVLQAGNFGVVVCDLAGAPADAPGRLPFTTWLRLQRMIEGTSTTCVLVADRPVARSHGGVTIVVSRQSSVVSPQSSVVSPQSSVVSPQSAVVGLSRRSRLFDGLDIDARVVRAHHHECRMPNPESRITTLESRVPNPESRSGEAAGVRLHLQAAV